MNAQPMTHDRSARQGSGRRALALAASLSLALGGLVLGGGVAPTPAHADTCTAAAAYDYTGGAQCFQVPAGVTSVTVDVYGAQGGQGGPNGGSGGLGTDGRATLPVTPGEAFQINVGGQGAYGSSAQGGGSSSVAGGWNGGGSGGGSDGTSTSSGGGGGGASDIRIGAGGLADRVIVAAGGGGGARWGGDYTKERRGAGGQGGGMGAGQNALGAASGCADNPSFSGGPGGAANQGGGGGGDNGYYYCGGGGGGLAGGGNGGGNAGNGAYTADNGSLGAGGAGSCIQLIACMTDIETGGGGGGGGGGYYGGGGGEAGGYSPGWGDLTEDGGGGGGGSSYVAASGAAPSFTPGVEGGNGKVLISYASTVTLRSSANPNSFYQRPTFTATVSPTPAGGYVTFSLSGHAFSSCDAQPLTNGVATCTEDATFPLSVGDDPIVATFSGYGGEQGSTATLTQRTVAQSNVSVGSSAPTVVSGQPVTLTATVNDYGSPLTTPTGKVTFYSDGKPLAAATLTATSPAHAQASVSTTTLPLGTHAITASYAGDGSSTSGASTALSQVVQGGEINDTAPGIAYSGAWGYYGPGRGKGDYQDDVHATSTAGASFSYTWNGTGINYIAEKSANEGTVAIYVDGAYKGTVSGQASARNVPRQLIYSISGLPAGMHKLMVVNRTQNSWMLLDALKVQ